MISVWATDETAKRMALRTQDLLAQQQSLRTTTSVIVVEAASGELSLKGRVRTNTLRNLAQRLARNATDGWHLHNELISDEQLAMDIAARLAMDPRTVMADVRCEVFLGVVNLKGVVKSPDQRQAVVELARQVPGIVSVNDLLAIGAGNTPRTYLTAQTQLLAVRAEKGTAMKQQAASMTWSGLLLCRETLTQS